MTVADLTGLPPRPIIKVTGELVSSDRNCGVEIELERVNPREVSRNLSGIWDVTDDHSLRPINESCEIRSLPGGVCGQRLIDSIDAFCKLGYTNTKHFSWRTGLHVHVDVRDKVPADIKVMGTMYALLEPFIFNWVGQGRHESRFSMPWWIVAQDITTLHKMQEAGTAQRDGLGRRGGSPFFEAVNRFSKYTALNLAPMIRLGTVEFRHGQSTGDRSRILGYVNLCLSIVEASKSDGRPTQCAEMVDYYVRFGPMRFMQRYVGKYVAKLLQSDITGVPPLTEAIIRNSVEAAMHIAELDTLAQGAIPPDACLNTLEALVSNRNTQQRRRLHRTLRADIDELEGLPQAGPERDAIFDWIEGRNPPEEAIR